jgi:hypothetical protein
MFTGNCGDTQAVFQVLSKYLFLLPNCIAFAWTIGSWAWTPSARLSSEKPSTRRSRDSERGQRELSLESIGGKDLE